MKMLRSILATAVVLCSVFLSVLPNSTANAATSTGTRDTYFAVWNNGVPFYLHGYSALSMDHYNYWDGSQNWAWIFHEDNFHQVKNTCSLPFSVQVWEDAVNFYNSAGTFQFANYPSAYGSYIVESCSTWDGRVMDVNIDIPQSYYAEGTGHYYSASTYPGIVGLYARVSSW